MASILTHDTRAEHDDGALAALRTLPQRVQRTAAARLRSKSSAHGAAVRAREPD